MLHVFSSQGKSKVHVSGYYVPHEDDGEGEDEDDDGIMELEDGDLFGEVRVSAMLTFVMIWRAWVVVVTQTRR